MKYLIVDDNRPVKIATAEEIKEFVMSAEGYSSNTHRVFQLGAEVTVGVNIFIKPKTVYRDAIRHCG